jgi:hypothetical protein
MLQTIAKERLEEMEAGTIETFDLLTEFHRLKLGEAISKAKWIWPEYGNGSWDDVRDLAGEDDDHHLIAFLCEDCGNRYRHPADEEHFFLAKLYGDAARILREHGARSCEDLPGADQQMFSRWVDVGECSATIPKYDLNEAIHVPIPDSATDKMLKLLYPDCTPEALRESAQRNEGVADLWDIHDQRDIKAISEGLRAQFGRWHKGNQRIREYLKAELTADLAADPSKPFGPGCSDRRLLAVSKEVQTQAEHDKLMAEIEAGFPGWCRECGTPPDRNGCSACRPARQAADTSTPADPPF